MKNIECVSCFLNRPMLNVLVKIRRIISIVAPSQKKTKKQKANLTEAEQICM